MTRFSGRPHGSVTAIPSKSAAHRYMICAALAQGSVEHIIFHGVGGEWISVALPEFIALLAADEAISTDAERPQQPLGGARVLRGDHLGAGQLVLEVVRGVQTRPDGSRGQHDPSSTAGIGRQGAGGLRLLGVGHGAIVPPHRGCSPQPTPEGARSHPEGFPKTLRRSRKCQRTKG